MLLRKIISVFSLFTFLIQGSLTSSIASLFLDEIEAIDRAILNSEKRVAMQHEIKKSMIELRRLEESIVKVENSKEAASQMVHLAEKLLTMIQEERLESLFSSPYMEELRFYSSFARKTSLSPKKLE
jgi:methylphosphotriester-DNA--protein-cysteine methyltransferase